MKTPIQVKRRAGIMERRGKRWINARGIPRFFFDGGLWFERYLKTAIFVLALLLPSFPSHAQVNLEAIQKIESNGNPKAFNRISGARGLYQITPVCLAHYNQFQHECKGCSPGDWTPNDLFDPTINQMVAEWYFYWLRSQGLSDVEQIIAYNWGIGNLRKWQAGKRDLPKETQVYLTKYQCLTAGDCK